MVERDRLLGADRVEPGDVVLALAVRGLHSNGYSLVRQVFFTDAGWSLDRQVPELGRTLGEELLSPTRIYAAGLPGADRAVSRCTRSATSPAAGWPATWPG